MTCCIVGLLIMATVGRLRRTLGLRGVESAALFAPVARRPAPGQTLPAIAAQPHASPATTAVLRYAVVGVVIGTVLTPLLIVTGIGENTGTVGAWLLRTLGYVALGATAVILSRTVAVGRRWRGVGWLLIAVGAVVFELGILDMHVFGLFDLDHGNLLADMAFHNVGPALILAGAMVLLYGLAGRTITSRRSSRSTVTSARPPASAVTVSSTPPTTT